MKNNMMKVCILLAASGMALAGCAMQEDVVILDKRYQTLNKKMSEQERIVASLSSDMSETQNTSATTSQTLRGSQADLRTLVNELRDEIQTLRGTLEENQYMVKEQSTVQAEDEKQRALLEQSVQSTLDRVVRIEAYLGMEPSEKLVTPETSQKTIGSKSDEKPSKDDTPEKLYASAKQHFDKGEYEKARGAFQAFLKKYPKSKSADNAQFWLGEIYYREKWYEKAILEYQKVIERYPKGNKVSSALLKQGFAFLNLGDKDNARLILKELIRKNPDSNEAKIAKDKLKNL